jgi:CubicO group peptidase (beta-lactamase class C family)
MPRRLSVSFFILWGLAAIPFFCGQQAAGEKDLAGLLGPIRQKHNVPALGGAIVTSNGLDAIGVVGVRKAGTEIAATADDKWHLGSDTKAMTAVLIATLVEQGRLKWETTIEEAFPDLAVSMSPAFRKINLLELLSHRAGLPANLFWGLIPHTQIIREQRLASIKAASTAKLDSEPGTKYFYSNLGYVIAGAMAEGAADESWDDLINRILFQPLGMESAGFGGVGTSGQIDQPWGHTADGKPVKDNGPDTDNPPVLGPAGRVHCTLSDWAKFIADGLRGARGGKGSVKAGYLSDPADAPFRRRLRAWMGGCGTRMGRREGIDPRRQQYDEPGRRLGCTAA